jgi:hypothetical protein
LSRIIAKEAPIGLVEVESMFIVTGEGNIDPLDDII